MHQSSYRYSSLLSVSGHYAMSVAVSKLGQTSALTKLGLLSDHWIAKLWQCDYSVVRPSSEVQIWIGFNADYFTVKGHIHF